MNNNQICNPKVEVPTGLNLNDKDYINSLLSIAFIFILPFFYCENLVFPVVYSF